MSIFFRKEFYSKAVSLLLTLAFLVESTLAPILLSLPQTAVAQTASSITISRAPSTSPSDPFKFGDATTLLSTVPVSFFTIDSIGTGYHQIGSNAPRAFAFSTFTSLRDSQFCNAATGQCAMQGNWSASDFLCPDNVTGVQQMKEWYVVNGITSNTITWYFECSATDVPSEKMPVGYLDGITSDGIASGWAVDSDSVATPISVLFYIDGAAGQGGIYAGSAVANLANQSANSAGYSGHHGYSFPIPSQWRDGKEHKLYVHGLDLSGDWAKNMLLSRVPKNFTIGTPLLNEPTLSIFPSALTAGSHLTVSITDAAANGTVKVFCRGPNNVVCDDSTNYTTDASGRFTHTYDTTGWAAGTYSDLVTVNDVKSNAVDYVISAVETTLPIELSLNRHQTPTPTTAPMATLTLEREQEQVLPDQPISFSGTLDNGVLNAAELAFPQGSSFFIAIPEKTSIERIEIDGKALGAGEFTLSGGNAKIPFSQALYNGSHLFRIVLRNEVSLVPQLDRNISVWVSVVGADGALLLKGRTASTMMAHLPTEVIGKGVTLSVPPMLSGPCCWSSVAFPLLASDASPVPGSSLVASNKIKFPIREFSFGETDVTRGPFFTPNQMPLLPENIAFTLFPGDASMQRIGLSLKQFSDPLAREFITAEYQYLLGRDPSSEEMARYLSKFTQWRNPLANLAEVYNRRPDIQQLVLVPRDKNIGGSNSGSPRPSWDKLLEWVRASGWKEESSLASFKPQSGFDNGWQLFRELWTTYAPLVGLENMDRENYDDYFMADVAKNPISAIAYLCRQSNVIHGHYPKPGERIDFEFCWKNDPAVRNYAILWAKNQGWAYNSFVTEQTDGGDVSYTYPVVVTISPSGPILASMFAPGKYPEFAEEQQWRYPPAQLYYDLIASPEYAQSIEKRFRANIDSVIRLFFGRPSTESDIAWAKDKFISGGIKKSLGYGKFYSWITPQWEPNGMLIASNFQYVDETEFVKNPHFITDEVYGIRNIQGEIDAVSSRLIEMIEKHGRQELYQGDSFKRIVSGLYRLYLRRTPTDAEVEKYRASKKDFGEIEMDMNQSKEYSKTPASDAAIKNLYRNYLSMDPNDADIAQWGDKTISSIANKMGKSAEMKEYAQQHPENAYIFPIKHIKMVKCGFFCSIFKLRWTSLTSLIPGYGLIINMAINLGYGISGAVSGPQAAGRITSITMNSISRGFNEAGFNGETFVQRVSIARAMAGQAGGVFSMTNVLENADPTILDGFRTMAVAPQASGNAFAQAGQPFGLASPLGAVAELFGVAAPAGRIAQIDVSSHYGSGVVAPVKNPTGTAKTATTKTQFTKTLKHGSRGAEVLKLQKLLGASDLAFLPEHQTGYYGAKTVAAVKRFQKRNGLEQVGFVGAKTRMLLNSIAK